MTSNLESHDRNRLSNGGLQRQVTFDLLKYLNFAFTRYCYYQYCTVHGVHKGGWGGGVVFCAIDVQ